MVIIVSRCLLGDNCRYKGDNCLNEKVAALKKKHTIIPVCPEELGGLPTPRDPGERVGEKVISDKGKDITEEYYRGAKFALEIALKNGADLCVFKAKSPSCGCGVIYDGTFTGNMILGDGVTTELMKKQGIRVITELDLDAENL